jgi:hypothetical protein
MLVLVVVLMLELKPMQNRTKVNVLSQPKYTTK